MANGAFVEAMKTITQSLIRKAGFDKTRSGKVVGVNTLTNTYSVKVDGYTYNNVRVVNDATYNVGDTVKVNIPVNQMSQAYISASIFSDASIGKKIGHAEKLIDAIDGQLEDVKEIDGHIYQLDIVSVYGLLDSDNKEISTHTGNIYKDGVEVEGASYWDNFRWYLMTSTGKEAQTTVIEDNTLTLPIDKYLYGMVLILEWVDGNNNVLLRKQTTLIDNSEIAGVEVIASNAYQLADNTDNYFWNVESGTDTGAHITNIPQATFITATTDAQRGYNLLAKPTGIALRYGYQELAQLVSDKLTFNVMNNGTLYKSMELQPTSLVFYDGAGSSTPLAEIDTSGMTLYEGTSIIAQFGATGATIGKTGQAQLILNSTSLELKDKERNSFFKVVDARNATTGYATYTDYFVGDGDRVFFDTSFPIAISRPFQVFVNNVEKTYQTDYIIVDGPLDDNDSIRFLNGAPEDGFIVKVVYDTSSEYAKFYNIGYRDDSSTKGALSVIEGYNTIGSGTYSHAEGEGSEARGKCSHAEGYHTKAFGVYAHAEGYDTIASGNFSHAEGWKSKALANYSHAEGLSTTASGYYSHAEGNNTTALWDCAHAEGYNTIAAGDYSHAQGYGTSTCEQGYEHMNQGYCAHAEGLESLAYGSCSHAQNFGTIASRLSQTVIGEYNTEDTYVDPHTVVQDGAWEAHGKYAFIIGNGTADDARSNALTVDWDGKLECRDAYVDVKDITQSISVTKTSGNSTCSVSAAVRSGNVVMLALVFSATANIAAGNNMFVGTISGALPNITTEGIGYTGDSSVLVSITSTGALTARVIGGQVENTQEPGVYFTYIV